MDYIYTRVSTHKQSHGAQLLKLRSAYPEAKIVEETESGVKERPMLKALLGSLKAGDRIIVYSLDRLGRRAHEVLPMLEDLKQREIILVSMREGVDYGTIAGRLVTQIFVSMAEMEREITSERTKAGLEAARNNGSLLGRPKTISDETMIKAFQLVSNGMSIPSAARDTGMSNSYLRKRINMRKMKL